jgi:outer membrane immunogenic protein
LSTGGAIPAGTFYNAPFANAGNAGTYRVQFKETPTVGGTLGCNWQRANSPWVLGAEGETGFMRLRARAVDPYSAAFNGDTIDATTIGNWYGSIAGRFGFAYERAWFYGKAGVGFTGLGSTVTDTCSVAPCGTGLLSASSGNTMRAFPVGGGGIEWAWTGNWTLKFEYLFLGLNETLNACDPGGGTAAGSTFCAAHSVPGVHTTKLGLNYKIF